MEHQKTAPPWWIKAILITASVYSIAWGMLMILYPSLLFKSMALESPNYMFLWQTLGLAETIFGLGLYVASRSPYSHWLLVLMPLLFKTLASAIYFHSAFDNNHLWTLTNYIFIDNLIWLFPFCLILYKSYRFHLSSDEYELEYFSGKQFTLDMFETSHGDSLLALSHQRPVMLVFLRHFGCTFCREAMHDIATQRRQIESQGVSIVIVHMLEDEDLAYEQLKKYGLEDLPTISDPEKMLYKKFQLRQGTFTQLAGLKVWLRGFKKGLIEGLGIGPLMGDPFQMPGIFLIYQGRVVKQFIHQSVADRPRYVELANMDS